MAAWLRAQDRRAAAGVSKFVANSQTVAGRIKRAYGVDASVVYPPVALAPFLAARSSASRAGGAVANLPVASAPVADAPFVAGGRMVPYKGLDIAIRAANEAQLPLHVFGDGPERGRLEALAGPTVRFLGRVSDAELPEVLAGARAFVFPAEEDFGILPVEALAAGTPVLALATGGAAETVGGLATVGAGALVDSRAPEAWAAAMLALAPTEMVPAEALERYSSPAFQSAITVAAQSLL